MSPEFDPRKDAANRLKHGVSLAEGDGVLSDPCAITIEDERAEGEVRYVTIGANLFDALRVVVWTARGAEVRVISVRRPTRTERARYAEGI